MRGHITNLNRTAIVAGDDKTFKTDMLAGLIASSVNESSRPSSLGSHDQTGLHVHDSYLSKHFQALVTLVANAVR